MEYVLPPLPYSYDALEPYIDALTMEIHYTKHHQKYVDELNAALVNYPLLQVKSLEELFSEINTYPAPLATAITNNGGGHLNHSFFWRLMKKNAQLEPSGPVAQAIKRSFGHFNAFQDQFNTAAKKVFGSGWAWLCVDKQGQLVVMSTPNQNPPLLSLCHPILGLDVWEHAYYLKYQNKRPDYIAAWWHVINWQQVEDNYHAILNNK
jgi:Fe-Mn family superoxide dismutase